ncbi:MAG: hypothetical protein K6G16_04505 [Lachnospiraceae bacterium]|nr:hypothetical protein [Lachnospiraceae bacterium]
MGVSAVVTDGKIANMESAMSKDQKSSSSNVDKDQFMTLLVAQMKYQDPLQPTSNTEYISQYATFSELEQMQNMSKSLELSRASELVGKLVVISPTEDNMLTSELQGQVDAVTYSGNKAYISVGGRTFSANDVTQVMSDDYATAVEAIEMLAEEIDKLPNINEISLENQSTINGLNSIYQAFSAETKALMEPAYVTKLNNYVSRIESLLEVEAENARIAAEAAAEEAAKTAAAAQEQTDDSADNTETEREAAEAQAQT